MCIPSRSIIIVYGGGSWRLFHTCLSLAESVVVLLSAAYSVNISLYMCMYVHARRGFIKCCLQP